MATNIFKFIFVAINGNKDKLFVAINGNKDKFKYISLFPLMANL
jgi:hypothetical protein